MTHLVLALFLIGIGMSVAGTGTHLYQQVARKMAGFRVEGRNAVENLVSLFVVFICGPYLMLRLGWQDGTARRFSPLDVMIVAIIAFAWSFVTGLMIVGTYVSVIRVSA